MKPRTKEKTKFFKIIGTRHLFARRLKKQNFQLMRTFDFYTQITVENQDFRNQKRPRKRENQAKHEIQNFEKHQNRKDVSPVFAPTRKVKSWVSSI